LTEKSLSNEYGFRQREMTWEGQVAKKTLGMAGTGAKTPLSAIFERSRNLEEKQAGGAGSTAHNQRFGNLARHR
jgi:hypothetical protein